MEVSLREMLAARERRAARQRALLEEGGTLICFTMNVAGPIKINDEIETGFSLGLRRLENQLRASAIPVLRREERREVTGCEALLLVQGDALAVKRLTVALEQNDALGRLFDMDVLRGDGSKVERQELGMEGRRCLLCDNAAQVCARSRAHRLEELWQETETILRDAAREELCIRSARLAVQALLYEAATTPKPGLVDRRDSGSHRDMDFFTFQASAAGLWHYFYRCTAIGFDTRGQTAPQTLAALRFPGREAEGEMFRISGGVNTHKGAIFSLGILCGALGRLREQQRHDAACVLAECASMTRGELTREFADLTERGAATAGERLYLRHGITGVRGQAEAGFPAVGEIGLPKLEEGLARGMSINDAGCAALLAMLAQTDDTNLIHRGGYERAQALRREIGELLRREPFPDEKTLVQWNDVFVEENLSPGGTADLLAMVYLLHFWKENAHE